MSFRGIGFGDMLNAAAQAEIETWTPNHSTVIECESCETKFYYHDLIKEDKVPTVLCECESLKIRPIPASAAKYEDFIGVEWDGEYPKIYEISYEEYLKNKQ